MIALCLPWTHDPCVFNAPRHAPSSRLRSQANQACESAGIKLLNDMAEIAAAEGIRPEAMNVSSSLRTVKAI